MSQPTVGSIDAVCQNCTKIKKLEACIHCMQPICSDCVNLHLDLWKANCQKYYQSINVKVDKYLNKIGTINPFIAENKNRIEKVKGEIEESFNNFIQILNNQKNDLFKQLDEIENDGEYFKSFERDIIDLQTNVKEMIEINESDSGDVATKFKRFQEFRDQVHKIGSNYSGLKRKGLRVIGEYEKPIASDFEKNYFGNLIINESELLKSDRKSNTKTSMKEKSKSQEKEVVKEPEQNIDQSDKIHMFGTLRVKLRRIAEHMNELQPINKNPTVEFDLPFLPKYITNYNKIIYIMDEDANTFIAELGNSLACKAQMKLNIMNVKSIAVNKKYLAVSFSDLNTEQINQIGRSFKKFDSKSGVFLYRLTESHSAPNQERLISSSKNYNLIAPNGIALNDNYLFVCDRELHAIFKIEIKTGNFIQKLITTDQEPISISLGDKYFVYTDALKLELSLVDSDKLQIIKTVKFSDELFNEPFDLSYKENSYIFVKNRMDTKVIIYDQNLNIKYSFDYDGSASLGINYLKLKSDYLLLGNLDQESKIFKLGLFSDF